MDPKPLDKQSENEIRYMQRLQIEAYFEGMRAGVADYAFWRDGVQYVGGSEKPLKDALIEIENLRAKRLSQI